MGKVKAFETCGLVEYMKKHFWIQVKCRSIAEIQVFVWKMCSLFITPQRNSSDCEWKQKNASNFLAISYLMENLISFSFQLVLYWSILHNLPTSLFIVWSALVFTVNFFFLTKHTKFSGNKQQNWKSYESLPVDIVVDEEFLKIKQRVKMKTVENFERKIEILK